MFELKEEFISELFLELITTSLSIESYNQSVVELIQSLPARRTSMVRLVPMTSGFYKCFLEQAAVDLAGDKVRSGNWQAEGALRWPRQVFQQFLPQGLDTPEQHLYSINADEDGSEPGYMWYGITGEGGQRAAYLYELCVELVNHQSTREEVQYLFNTPKSNTRDA